MYISHKTMRLLHPGYEYANYTPGKFPDQPHLVVKKPTLHLVVFQTIRLYSSTITLKFPKQGSWLQVACDEKMLDFLCIKGLLEYPAGVFCYLKGQCCYLDICFYLKGRQFFSLCLKSINPLPHYRRPYWPSMNTKCSKSAEVKI